MRPLALVLLALAAASTAQAQAPADSSAGDPAASRFSLRGYGSAVYAAFDWETDPARRSAVDLERLVLYPSVRLSPRVSVDAEVEIEHGGTGASIEFDVLEEFGEFEQEVEQGGAVVLEQMNVNARLSPLFGIRAGRVKVPFGLAGVLDEPAEYLTTTRSEAEAFLIPTVWYEDGVQAYGEAGRLSYAVSVVNGFDSSGFSSQSWVVRGHQRRFETINADAPAVAVRLDAHFGRDEPAGSQAVRGFAGISGYAGNTSPNRPRPDLASDAWLVVGDVHAAVEAGPVWARALVLGGHLQNADLVSQANRNLSNALGVARTPVGSAAVAASVELAVDVLALAVPASEHVLRAFGRVERYDTQAATTGAVFDNPRWQRTAVTAGLNWLPIPALVVKGQLSHRALGDGQTENTASLGLGFEF